MSDVKAALVEIRRMTKQFKAFEAAEQALTVLAGYEQNVAELTAKIAELNEQVARQCGVIREAGAELQNNRAEAKQVITLAKTRADQIVARAEADIVQRREEADVNLNNTATALAGLEEQHAELNKAVEAKKAELEAVEGGVASARATLTKLATL